VTDLKSNEADDERIFVPKAPSNWRTGDEGSRSRSRGGNISGGSIDRDEMRYGVDNPF